MGKDLVREIGVSEASTQDMQKFLGRKEEGSNNNPFAVLKEMVADGRLVLATKAEVAEIVAKTEKAAATRKAEMLIPTPATVAPTERKEAPTTTKAGVKEYNDFFGLFAKQRREGGYFRSLGFIPGPAVILNFRKPNGGWEVQITAATSDVAKGIQIPTPWMKTSQLPEKMMRALVEHKAVVDGLGYEPSPYNLGLARALLGGQVPAKYLAMVMPKFRYRPGDPELPFGVVLTLAEDGMKLERVYNPQCIPDVPAKGAVFSLAFLKDDRGPTQKLLRTWALMEGNFLARYAPDGSPRR